MQVDFLTLTSGKSDGDVSKFSAPVTDHDIGFTSHGSVSGGLGEHGAEYGVITFGGNAADGVARVEVFDIEFNVVGFEVSGYFFFARFTAVAAI